MNTDNNSNEPVAANQQLVIAELRNQLARYEQVMNVDPDESSDEDSIDLREYWNVLVRRRWTVFITIGVLVIGTIIATAMMTPIYRGTTVVQIERDSGKVLEYQAVTAEEAVNDKDFYQTQYELLRSRTLARRVIEQLGLRDSGALMPGKPEPTLFGGIIVDLIGAADKEDGSLPEQRSPDLETLFLESLVIQPVRNSRLVRLNYFSTDPNEAALVANTIASSFVDMSLERRFEASAYAKNFLEERLKQVRADLEDSERAMIRYTQERGIINQEDKLGILTEKLKEMNRAQVQVEAERIAAESQYQEMLKASTASLAEMLDSPVIQDLKRQRSDLESEYKENLKIYKPDYPKMLQLKEKIGQVDQALAKEIGHIRDGIKVKYQAKMREEAKLAESIDATRTEILDLELNSTDFQTLKRGVDTNRELYDGLLQRMKEVGVAAGASNNNISVIDKAEVPRNKFSPSLKMNVSIALALGLFFGVLLAFLFETLDDTVKSAADLEKSLKKPVLGVIPRADSKDAALAETALVSVQDPTSAMAEAYRSMRTALSFSTAEGAPKVMQFTSINANEGKTTTAVNVSLNLTQTGATVLLIDGDLRDPSLHKLFGRPNNEGLTNYLTGNAQPVDVTQSSGTDGLFLMTAGPVPPNPAELLHGARLVDLVALASQRFDYVIIDSPPLLGLADAVIISDVVQATIMVAAANKTRVGAFDSGLKRLRHSRANILGAVLTQFRLNRSSYGYDYSYSYSYTYGEGSSQNQKIA